MGNGEKKNIVTFPNGNSQNGGKNNNNTKGQFIQHVQKRLFPKNEP